MIYPNNWCTCNFSGLGLWKCHFCDYLATFFMSRITLLMIKLTEGGLSQSIFVSSYFEFFFILRKNSCFSPCGKTQLFRFSWTFVYISKALLWEREEHVRRHVNMWTQALSELPFYSLENLPELCLVLLVRRALFNLFNGYCFVRAHCHGMWKVY
jgi:hypothetical protein